MFYVCFVSCWYIFVFGFVDDGSFIGPSIQDAFVSFVFCFVILLCCFLYCNWLFLVFCCVIRVYPGFGEHGGEWR